MYDSRHESVAFWQLIFNNMENKDVFDDICNFASVRLRPVETTVTLPSGERYVESKSQVGRRYFRKNKLAQTFGFVGDVKPDLQVASIVPGLYLGSQDVAQDENLLRQHSITHVLNCAIGVGNYFQNDLIYKKLEIYDIPDCNIAKNFDESFTFIDNAVKRGNVFVHCNAGISRAATLVIAYLMRKQKMSFADAHAIVKSARPIIRPNDGFVKQLQEYEAVVLAS